MRRAVRRDRTYWPIQGASESTPWLLARIALLLRLEALLRLEGPLLTLLPATKRVRAVERLLRLLRRLLSKLRRRTHELGLCCELRLHLLLHLLHLLLLLLLLHLLLLHLLLLLLLHLLHLLLLQEGIARGGELHLRWHSGVRLHLRLEQLRRRRL